MRRRRPFARASSRFVACVALALACWSSRCESTSAKDADAAARALRDELSTLRHALQEAKEASTALGKAVHGAERALKRMGGLVKTPGVAATDETRCDAGGPTKDDEMSFDGDSKHVASSSMPVSGELTLEEIRRAAEEHVRAALAGESKRSKTFSDAFDRVSAARVSTKVTAVHVLPFRNGKARKARYYATGDEFGRIVVRRTETGDAECEVQTNTTASVRSMTAYLLALNTTVLVTGHDDGTVAFTKIEQEVVENVGPDADAFPTDYTLRASSLAAMTVREANAKYRVKLRELGKTSRASSSSSGALEHVEESFPVEALGMYRIMGKRYVTAADTDGRVVVFLPSLGNFANVHGVFSAGSKVFAFRPYNKAVVALTRRGVAYADINAFTTKSYACDGLMRYDIASATFDPRMSSRLTGITTEGHVISGFVALDGPRTGCVIYSGAETHESRVSVTTIAALRGYVVVAMNAGLEILNITNTKIAKRVLHSRNRWQLADEGVTPTTAGEYAPVIASDGESQIVISHPDEGAVFVYESAMYVAAPASLLGENPWFQPLAVMIALGVGIWSYRRQKMSFTPEARSSSHNETMEALRKLGYGQDMARARALVSGETRPGYEPWTPATIRKEVEAARLNGDL